MPSTVHAVFLAVLHAVFPSGSVVTFGHETLVATLEKMRIPMIMPIAPPTVPMIMGIIMLPEK